MSKGLVWLQLIPIGFHKRVKGLHFKANYSLVKVPVQKNSFILHKINLLFVLYTDIFKVWWHYATLFDISWHYATLFDISYFLTFIHTLQSYIHSSFTIRRSLSSCILIASSLSNTH
jgi:hypothetical protein